MLLFACSSFFFRSHRLLWRYPPPPPVPLEKKKGCSNAPAGGCVRLWVYM
jgi:hypothetical protein